MDRNRILTIFGAAWVSAALLTWFLYARTQAPKVDKTVRVVAAAKDLPAGTRLKKEDVKLVDVFQKNVPPSALNTVNEGLGRALLYPANANEVLTSVRLTSTQGAEGAAAVISPGKRAVSVSFTDASGAAGLIQPQSRVDILFTRTGSAVEAMTVTVLEDVEVLSVGRNIQVDTTQKASAPGSSTQQRTATLIVSPEQAQRLELAKNQGRISLSLRNPLDRSTQSDRAAAAMEDLDPMLVARSGVRKLPKMPANVKDRKAWASLIGDDDPGAAKPVATPKPLPVKPEPPPKPKHTVDVFRGEKHVQEIFQ
ncbi:MAG: Flp pilus assembly protein CpaB [Bryobacterales bacterium]|nr:Flp pilus assembly protein CpaB [Bryobacterales bacterium]